MLGFKQKKQKRLEKVPFPCAKYFIGSVGILLLQWLTLVRAGLREKLANVPNIDNIHVRFVNIVGLPPNGAPLFVSGARGDTYGSPGSC